MRILINDVEESRESYINIYQSVGYEPNELIFRNGFEETRAFLLHLEKNKLHIDLIVTNKDEDTDRKGILGAENLLFLKHRIPSSYSKGNFQIAAIPIILYSSVETKTWGNIGYDAVVQKNTEGEHGYFVLQSEKVIKNWRCRVLEDLDALELKPSDLRHFPFSNQARNYFARIRPKAEYYFTEQTEVLSLEYIKSPRVLEYDWIQMNLAGIEQPYEQFLHTLKHHIKYGKKVNERTVWHELFKKYDKLLLRDVYEDYLYERNLREASVRESQECDFILTTEFPDYQATTFLEVKREDKRYYVKEGRKRPRFSSKFYDDVEQIWRYYKYTIDPLYQAELAEKIGYAAKKFDFVLLAGRREEKEEMKDMFASDLNDHYRGIKVQSFEDFADTYVNYMEKFSRLAV